MSRLLDIDTDIDIGDGDNLVDTMRLSRPFSPKYSAETLARCTGWKIDSKKAPLENEHLKPGFTVVSNGIEYPVILVGLRSIIDDYCEDKDPLLLGLIEEVKEKYDRFIFLTGEGVAMTINDKDHQHLLGIVHKNNQSSFLFLCKTEPDDQHGKVAIKAVPDFQEWANIDREISKIYVEGTIQKTMNEFKGITVQ